MFLGRDVEGVPRHGGKSEKSAYSPFCIYLIIVAERRGRPSPNDIVGEWIG